MPRFWKTRAGNFSDWHPLSEEYCHASTKKIHLRWPDYINHRSPPDHKGFTKSRHWMRVVYGLVTRI